jgi:hypothetical protein
MSGAFFVLKKVPQVKSGPTAPNTNPDNVF